MIPELKTEPSSEALANPLVNASANLLSKEPF
jgi:hypothetical protein